MVASLHVWTRSYRADFSLTNKLAELFPCSYSVQDLFDCSSRTNWLCWLIKNKLFYAKVLVWL